MRISSSRRVRLAVSLALGIQILGLAATVDATPLQIGTTSVFLNMQGVVCAPQCGSQLNTTFTLSTDNGPTSILDQVLLGGAGNSALVSSFADFGQVRVLAETDTRAADSALGQMDAIAAGFWTDDFAITSPHLAAGTIVQAKFIVRMDGFTSVSAGTVSPDPSGATALTGWNFFESMTNFSHPTDVVEVCASSSEPSGCFLPPNLGFEFEQTAVFNLVVGDVNTLTGMLEVFADAVSATMEPGAFANASVASAAFNSGHFYLQPLGDFTLVSSSGHDYSPPLAPPVDSTVPEPTSFVLLGSALTGVILKTMGIGGSFRSQSWTKTRR